MTAVMDSRTAVERALTGLKASSQLAYSRLVEKARNPEADLFCMVAEHIGCFGLLLPDGSVHEKTARIVLELAGEQS